MVSRRPVSRRFLSLALSLLTFSLAGGLTLAGTGEEAREDQTPAAVAVRALVEGTPEEALAAVPDDFAAVRGYQPVVEDGLLLRADGDCSSPVALPAEFEPACRQHDYGYDLLRYADQSGSPLGRWARGALDDRLTDELRDLCEEGPAGESCRRMASLAATGVEINSRRQGDGVPQESPLTQAALATTTLGALGLLSAALPARRRRR